MEEVSIVKKNFVHYIDQIVKNNKVSHAYLIEIDQYETDLIYIMNFIKMIISNMSYDNVINSDLDIFHQIDHNNYPDVQIVSSDGAWIKKGQMLDLQKEYSNKSLLNSKRIYVIKDAEKLNSSSANTMLKFIEEPEDNIIAILLTDNRYHVLETILSRCQILTLKEESIDISYDDQLKKVLDVVLYPDNFFINYSLFFSEILIDKDFAKKQLKLVENIIISYLNKDLSGNYSSSFSNVSEDVLLFKLSVIEDYLPKLDYNINYKMWLDSLFSKLTIGG